MKAKKGQIIIGKRLFTVNSNYINMLEHYKTNKTSDVGMRINCSTCGVEMIKTKAAYVFCGLQCKDDFWNKIDPRKRNSKRSSNVDRNYEEHWATQGDDWESCGYHNK